MRVALLGQVVCSDLVCCSEQSHSFDEYLSGQSVGSVLSSNCRECVMVLIENNARQKIIFWRDEAATTTAAGHKRELCR